MNIFMHYYSLFPLFIFIIFLYKLLFSSPKNRKKTAPSPPKLPLLGHIVHLGSNPHRNLHKLSKQHGPLMLLRFGSVPVLVASSSGAAREIMKDHDLIFSDRPTTSISNRLLYGSRDVAFSPYGEYWRQVRSICVLNLLSNKRVQSFRNVMEEETNLMVEQINKSCGSTINLSDIFELLSNNIICRVALGRKYSDDENVQKERKDIMFYLGDFIELMGIFNIGDYIPWLAWVNKINGLDRRVEKVAKELDEFFEGVVEEHSRVKKKEEDVLDLVDILLQIQGENTIGFPIHKETVKALILDMFAAGTHTNYTALEWTMAELIKNPKVMEKLQNEVRTNFKTDNDLETMEYLKAVIKESLRLHSPAPLLLPRKASQDANVMGFHVASGTQVLINSWAIGRDPTIWENPEEFKPERFLNSKVDYKVKQFEMIPFGAGRRGCPGITFGVTVVELALASLIREFDFALLGEEELDMNEAIGVTCHKKVPLNVIATPRVG